MSSDTASMRRVPADEGAASTPATSRAPNPARLWVGVYLAGFGVISMLFAWTLFTPPYVGDLTRMGFLSEREFGWRAPQPVVDAAQLRSERLADAEVLVVGDSFSTPSVWQSLLVKSGRRVKTVVWSDVHAVCSDFAPWLRSQGFRGDLVVIESVERELDDRVAASAACSTMDAQLAADTAAALAVPPPALPTAPQLNWGEQVLTGAHTALNTWRAHNASADLVFGETAAPFTTRVVPIPNGCRWFSHVECDKGLFLNKEFLLAPLGTDTLERIQAISERQTVPAGQKPLRLLWLVVPSKRHVYLDQPTDFWQRLERTGLGPNLPQVLRDARDSVRDLYLPNETHMSTAGYLLLGRAAQAAIERLPGAAR